TARASSGVRGLPGTRAADSCSTPTRSRTMPRRTRTPAPLAIRRGSGHYAPAVMLPHPTGTRGGPAVIRGFRNFLMQGSVVTIAIGLMVALAFSTLIKAFTDAIINPILNRVQGGSGIGLGIQLGEKGNAKTFVDIGSLLSAV